MPVYNVHGKLAVIAICPASCRRCICLVQIVVLVNTLLNVNASVVNVLPECSAHDALHTSAIESAVQLHIHYLVRTACINNCHLQGSCLVRFNFMGEGKSQAGYLQNERPPGCCWQKGSAYSAGSA